MGSLSSARNSIVFELSQEKKPILVGVSGGSDSVSLLHLVVETCPNHPIHVVHVHHGWRLDADGDEEFVRRLASDLDRPYHGIRLDPPRRSRGLEARARLARWRCFADIGLETGAESVLLGHTRDDQIETVLHRIGRGSGLRGLRGIRPRRRVCVDQSHLVLIRPLLGVSREWLRSYLRIRGREHREDSTNTELRFERNRIRHRVIPTLRDWNSDFDQQILELAALSDKLTEKAAESIRIAEAPLPPAWEGDSFLVEELRRQPIGIVMCGLRNRLAEDRYAGVRGRALDVLREVIEEGVPKGLTLRTSPHAIEARVENGLLLLGALKVLEGAPIDLEIPSCHRFPHWPAHLRIQLGRMEEVPSSPTSIRHAVELDAERLTHRLVARQRRNGDRFAPGVSLELKRAYQRARMPARLRSALPVIAHGPSLAWIPGVAVCPSLAADKSLGSERVVRLEWVEDR